MVQEANNRTKKVLVIAHAFPPFYPVGYSIRAVKFVKYLPLFNWLPVVLTVDDKEETFYARRVGSETLLKQIQPQVKIYRTNSGEPTLRFIEKEKKFSQKNILTAIISKLLGGTRRWIFRTIFLPDPFLAWFPFALWQGRKIMMDEGIEAIFATCPPHSDALIGAFIKKIFGKPLILDFRDDWIDTPWFHSRPKIVRIIEKQLESWVVSTADKVILVTEWSKNAFINRYPLQPVKKFVFLPNGCDLEEFSTVDSIPEQTHNTKFTIVHAGSLNDSKVWTRNLESLYKAISNLLQQQPDLADKLSLVFAGDFPEGHRKIANELGLSGVVQALGYLPHNEFVRLIKSANLLLAINYEDFSTLIPGKIYEYWAAGGPPIMLLSCEGAASQLITKRNLGTTVLPYDTAGIEKTIRTYITRFQAGEAVHISTDGIEEYDRKSITEKLAHILNSLV